MLLDQLTPFGFVMQQILMDPVRVPCREMGCRDTDGPHPILAVHDEVVVLVAGLEVVKGQDLVEVRLRMLPEKAGKQPASTTPDRIGIQGGRGPDPHFSRGDHLDHFLSPVPDQDPGIFLIGHDHGKGLNAHQVVSIDKGRKVFSLEGIQEHQSTGPTVGWPVPVLAAGAVEQADRPALIGKTDPGASRTGVDRIVQGLPGGSLSMGELQGGPVWCFVAIGCEKVPAGSVRDPGYCAHCEARYRMVDGATPNPSGRINRGSCCMIPILIMAM